MEQNDFNFDRNQIRLLVVQKKREGKSTYEISRELFEYKVSYNYIQRIVREHRKSGKVENSNKRNRKPSVRTPAAIKRIRDLIHKNGERSSRKLASVTNMSSTTVLKVLKEDLKLRPYKKRKIHGMSEAQKQKRFHRTKVLLDWRRDDEIIFSDEKLFLLQESFNPQNDRIWSSSIEDIPADKRSIKRFQNASSVMVWGAICKRGKLPLIFIEKGVKINQQYYLDNVLKSHLLVEAKKLFGDEYYCFQQDGAPAHTAKSVQEWCEENLPDFIPKDEWPPSSPDLNPLDFFVWGYMLQNLKTKKIHSLDSFKKAIMKIWDEIPMSHIRAACDSFFKRLELVRSNNGGTIEN